MASMMEMYQIAKDMADRQSASDPFANVLMSALRGYETGKDQRKKDEIDRYAQAKMLLDMQSKMQEIAAQKEKQNRERAFAQMAGVEPVDQTSTGKLFRAIAGQDSNSPLSNMVKELYPEMQEPAKPIEPRTDMIMTGMHFNASGGGATFKRKADIALDDEKTQAEINLKKRNAEYTRNRANFFNSSKDSTATENQLMEQKRKLTEDMNNNSFLMSDEEKAAAQEEINLVTQRLDEFRKTHKIQTPAAKEKKQITDPKDKAAYDWAQQNSKDPRAAKIMEKLKSKGY